MLVLHVFSPSPSKTYQIPKHTRQWPYLFIRITQQSEINKELAFQRKSGVSSLQSVVTHDSKKSRKKWWIGSQIENQQSVNQYPINRITSHLKINNQKSVVDQQLIVNWKLKNLERNNKEIIKISKRRTETQDPMKYQENSNWSVINATENLEINRN